MDSRGSRALVFTARSNWKILSQFASETAAPAACGPGVSERGGEGAGRGGGAWGRVPGAARVLLFGFFFSTRSARGARTKITPILGKNHARVEIIDLKSKSQAPARDFAYLGSRSPAQAGASAGLGATAPNAHAWKCQAHARVAKCVAKGRPHRGACLIWAGAKGFKRHPVRRPKGAPKQH
jgi:hypothetical protein